MRALYKTSVAAALSLLLEFGVIDTHATPVTVANENATTATRALLTGDPGQIESGGFNFNGPLGMTFTQLSADATPAVGSQGMLIPGSITPPPLSGAYVSDAVSPHLFAIVKYPATQLGNVLSPWGSSSGRDGALNADDHFVEPSPQPDLLTQPVSEVDAPSAAWPTLLGLLVVGLVTIRFPKPTAH